MSQCEAMDEYWSIGLGGGLGRSEFGPVPLCRPGRCRTAKRVELVPHSGFIILIQSISRQFRQLVLLVCIWVLGIRKSRKGSLTTFALQG